MEEDRRSPLPNGKSRTSAATHRSTLQHTATQPQHYRNTADATMEEDRRSPLPNGKSRTSAATHRSTLQHTATHCNALQQHVATPLQQTRFSLSLSLSLMTYHRTLSHHDVPCRCDAQAHCLKLQVTFRKRAANYRARLRKITCNLRHPMTLRHPVS